MNTRLVSYALVFAQFILIALVLSPVQSLFSMDSLSILGALFLVDAIALGAWALLSMNMGTFSVLPEPSSNAQMTTAGPYRWIRHPMYTAVILLGLGSTLSHTSIYHSLVFLLLVAVLLLKIAREEALLLDRYPNYRTYKANSKALIPWVY